MEGNGIREPCTARRKEAVFRWRAFRRTVRRYGSEARDKRRRKRKNRNTLCLSSSDTTGRGDIFLLICAYCLDSYLWTALPSN